MCLGDDSGTSDIVGALETASEGGFVDKSSSMFMFSHDMVQQATYELIPEENRKLYHKLLGELLVKHSHRVEDVDSILFVAANQANHALDLFTDPEERILFANLNLKAGLKTMNISEFDSALNFLRSGIILVEGIEEHWQREYSLSLDLFQKAAQVSLWQEVASVCFFTDLLTYFVQNH